MITKEPCDSNSTSCVVECHGNFTESGPVTYLWKRDDGAWMESESGANSNRLTVTKDKDWKVKTFSCEVRNEISRKQSDPLPNLLYEGMYFNTPY